MKKGKRSIHKICLLFAVALTLLLPFHGGNAFAEGELVSAPMNPEFIAYMEGLQKERVMAPGAPYEAYGLGLIPSPLNLDHLTGADIFGAPQVQEPAEAPLRLGLPSSYDLRTQGKLTPVRDQGTGNTCWTFATYGSLESNLLPGEAHDFSENHLKNTHGFDWGCNSGGNGDMSTAYLARWSGPVNETDDPYNPDSGVSPSGLLPRKHVQGVIYIPARSSASDNDNLKNAVMLAGAVMVNMNWTQDASYYNEGAYAYYYYGASGSNHAVAIVGWDDNYDKANFPSAPPGNGAFIVRNSWGTSFGDGGYFYISYYDTRLAYSMNYLFHSGESTTNYSRIYQYDPLGWLGSFGYSNETGWFANIFTAQASENLTAVSLYNTSLNSSYEIYIYTGVTPGVPRSGTLAATDTGTIQYPGYTTVDLSSPVYLSSGERFSIVVKLTAPGVGTPIPLEKRIEGYSSGATASPGQSFVSSDGSFWSDLTSIYANDNVCLKGFTGGSSLYATFTGYGLYSWNGTTWTKINGVIPASMAASGSSLYATFTGYGLY
ncbi:MAG TPA: lectin like domain-containing protein, partial [Syntrophorhabdaceae bacterium]|nr:lectin like domain-containing protein [Syntrophorhabdaceae bacterium]